MPRPHTSQPIATTQSASARAPAAVRLAQLLAFFLALFALMIVAVLIAGFFQPKAHTATASAIIDAPQSAVWAWITEVKTQPTWRAGLAAVEDMPAQNGHTCWAEFYGRNMQRTVCAIESVAPLHRVTQVTADDAAFGGTWTYDLKPIDAAHTQLAIREDGVISSALLRFVNHYIYGESTAIKTYERSLEAKARSTH
jgi:hypothetical protein